MSIDDLILPWEIAERCDVRHAHDCICGASATPREIAEIAELERARNASDDKGSGT